MNRKDYYNYFCAVTKPEETSKNVTYYYPDTTPTRPGLPDINRVIFNGPATIVFWADGDKTVVKCMEEEFYDPEKGLAMAVCKKTLGKDFRKTFKKFVKEKEEPHKRRNAGSSR